MDILATAKPILESTPKRWHLLIQTFPDDLLRRQPLDGEWSALECLLHLVDVDSKVFGARIEAFLAGENFPGFFPDEEGASLTADLSALDLVNKFEALRSDNLKIFEKVTAEDLSREAVHGELGTVTLSQLLHEWAGHDIMHTVQAEQAMLQPFIDGCGAWKPYFASHIAK